MRALDGIEPDEDDDDYGVEDVSEDDSLVGYMPDVKHEIMMTELLLLVLCRWQWLPQSAPVAILD